jgi:hypothetical protein
VNATYKPFLLSHALFLLLAVVFLLCLAFLHNANLSAYVGAAVSFLPYVAATLCAAYLGYAARTRVWLQLVALGCCVAVGFGLVNLAHEIFIGPVDFSGLTGSAFVVAMSSPSSCCCAFLGAAWALGFVVPSTPNISLNRTARRRRSRAVRSRPVSLVRWASQDRA